MTRRFERAQTIADAKARYVSADADHPYSLAEFERDVARILRGGEYPDVTCDGLHLGVCRGCPPPEIKDKLVL